MKPGDWQFSLRNLDPEPPQPRYVPKPKPKPKPEPRRTKSMPAPKQFIPSESMGDYEDMNRRKSAPSKVAFKDYLILNILMTENNVDSLNQKLLLLQETETEVSRHGFEPTCIIFLWNTARPVQVNKNH